MIRSKRTAIWGSIFMLSSIILGAMGAHSLKSILSQELLNSYNTATDYITYHGLALLIFSMMRAELNQALQLIKYGVLIFSGSIYLLTFLSANEIQASNYVGLITPLGGVLMIAGWAWTTIAIIQAREHKSTK